MKKKRNAVILWKKRNNYGKNVMVGTSALVFLLLKHVNTSSKVFHVGRYLKTKLWIH